MRGFLAGGAALSLAICCVYGCIDADETAFGNPNVLARSNLPGEAGAAVTPISVTCGTATFDGGCPTFATDIFPYLTANGEWQCSSANCHGGSQSPKLDCETPDTCFTSLEAVPAIDGKPYVDAGSTDPTASAFLCSLQGSCGDKMPKPPAQDPTSDELCVVSAWLKCGAPR